ncbi:fumarylacetoacetate hydrolase family protein [Piscinibacter sakaiensis]|uniref:fumarylacetoacetate hydrolase family protein n=1 Tax=Piscinibacter sakaiensis TaxID=1547922 RepID=UPI003AAF93AD
MKLASIQGPGGLARVAVVRDDRVFDVDDAVAALGIAPEVEAHLARHGLQPAAGGMLRVLQAGRSAWRQLDEAASGEGRPLADCTLLAPLPRPGKIVAVGRNYADHAKETGVAPFEKPRIIAKLPSSVTAPDADIPRPAGVAKLDFEVELAVLIGSVAKAVSQQDALNVVAGYTILNDLSAREFQFDVSPAQTTFAKSFDGFCPMGPWWVTADEIADPQALDLSCFVNGTEMQHGHTSDMLFPVARLIEYISSLMTLEPGDVIATGTPAGIGAFRQPPQYLQPGDRIRMEISRIGAIEHRIVA